LTNDVIAGEDTVERYILPNQDALLHDLEQAGQPTKHERNENEAFSKVKSYGRIALYIIVAVVVGSVGSYSLRGRAKCEYRDNAVDAFLYAENENVEKLTNMSERIYIENDICKQFRDLIWTNAHPLSYRNNVDLPIGCSKHFYLGKNYFIFICKRHLTNDLYVRVNQFKGSGEHGFAQTSRFVELDWEQFCTLAYLVETVLHEFDKLTFSN